MSASAMQGGHKYRYVLY